MPTRPVSLVSADTGMQPTPAYSAERQECDVSHKQGCGKSNAVYNFSYTAITSKPPMLAYIQTQRAKDKTRWLTNLTCPQCPQPLHCSLPPAAWLLQTG